MRQIRLAIRGAAFVFLVGVSSHAWGGSFDEAEEKSQQTGRPILAIGGRDSCGNTSALMNSLGQSSLKSTLAKYVLLTIDVDKPEWQQWKRKYGQLDGDTLPHVYVIRSDGEQLSSHTGPITFAETQKLLKSQSAKAGRALSDKELDSVAKALETAKQADANGDVMAGIEAFSDVKKLGVLGDTTSYAKPVVEANQLVEQWTEKGKAGLKSAEEQLSSSDATFDAALAYVRSARAFAQLPGLKEDVAAAESRVKTNASLLDLLRQANAVCDAQTLAATRDGRKKAAAAFSRIVTQFPNTDAAKLAADEVKKLGSGK